MFFGKQQENKVRKGSQDTILTDFDEVLWIFIIDKVVIEDDNNIKNQNPMVQGYKVRVFENITIINILLAVGCSILFYFLLDKCFDPIFENLYPASF